MSKQPRRAKREIKARAERRRHSPERRHQRQSLATTCSPARRPAVNWRSVFAQVAGLVIEDRRATRVRWQAPAAPRLPRIASAHRLVPRPTPARTALPTAPAVPPVAQEALPSSVRALVTSRCSAFCKKSNISGAPALRDAPAPKTNTMSLIGKGCQGDQENTSR